MNLDKWYEELTPVAYKDLPIHKGIFVTDMVNGFVHEGTLASPRVAELVDPIVSFVKNAKKHGTKLFVSIQDTHEKDAIEFSSFPEHCVIGTPESEIIPELENLVQWEVFLKNTLSPGIRIGNGLANKLLGWTEKRNPNANNYPHLCNVSSFIITGNCTDLCVYQVAMYIRQFFNEFQRKYIEVVVPANLVQTYDLPGVHDGDFFHKTFLYHMHLNGIKIHSEITF